MKRDMNLARTILLTLAESEKPIDASSIASTEYPPKMVGYHFQILDEAGLIVASVRAADNDPYYFAMASRLTWDGNDFLDSIRDDLIWKRASSTIGKATGGASLDVVKTVASSLVLETIKPAL
ncbi:MAG: DUF2513 domain-containing protein [Gordonibacter sp.]|uniref:DUF2513 domain-containing protein n=1 Tax=Gordonibacter sp. TaxID=1968902 RepID=UPI002FC78F4C